MPGTCIQGESTLRDPQSMPAAWLERSQTEAMVTSQK